MQRHGRAKWLDIRSRSVRPKGRKCGRRNKRAKRVNEQEQTAEDIDKVMALLREKLGAGGRNLDAALRKARHRLPRDVYKQALQLARAEPLAAHPKLRLTLDSVALGAAAERVRTHLETIDLADRRKGWWLGMLGGLAFNLLAFVALVVAVLMWRGLI